MEPYLLSPASGGAGTLSMVMSKRAFIARFPAMPDGISNKFAAITLYLNSDEYAKLLTPDQDQRIALRMQITMGILFLQFSANVNYGMTEAARFVNLLALPHIPEPFRLTEAERTRVMLDPIQPYELP